MGTLQEELDRSFGQGPVLPPVDVHVVAGRRAVRRRRVGRAAIGVAAATVLVASWYAVAPTTRGADLRGNDPASTTSASPTPSEGPSAEVVERTWSKGELIRYVGGQLEVRPGVTVHERIENPHGYEPPGLSDALDVTWNGQRLWLMIEKGPSDQGTSSSSSTPSNGWAGFADYVADQVVVTGQGPDGWPETFRLDDQGQVVPTPGTQVLNRTDDPLLGPTFAAPDSVTGAAVVTVAGDPASYFIVWRVVDGVLDVIATPSRDVVGADLDDLLSMARAKYASGEGLR